MSWANSTDIVYNTWKLKSKQPKCILSPFLGFLSCSQDLEGLNQEESLSVMVCPGGWSRHRPDRCTWEDQALLSVLGTDTAGPQHDGLSHAAFSVTFQVINAQQRNSPGKAGCRPQGFSLCLVQLWGEGVLQRCPESGTPFFFGLYPLRQLKGPSHVPTAFPALGSVRPFHVFRNPGHASLSPQHYLH